MEPVTIIKSTGEREAFDPTKLEASLIRAKASEAARSEIIGHVMKELKEGMSTSQIYKHAFFLLSKTESHAAVRYSLRRAVMDLGPSGFPFEKFIAEIFREKGFEVMTGQLVKGTCVEHEIDVVAYNENKLIFVEAKFHNGLGLKSDVKIALYVKARFDDLYGKKYNFGGERELSEGWLVTNTKFSKTAIEYGTCAGLRMIGWNYPSVDNLQDLIEDAGLHPLTSLTTLSITDKAALLRQGIVLAKTLIADTSYLEAIGLSTGRMQNVLNEIKILLA